MKKGKAHVGWYHETSTGFFGGFVYLRAEDEMPSMTQLNGPFPTLAAAKRDAIAYHKADIAHAKECLREIREAMPS